VKTRDFGGNCKITQKRKIIRKTVVDGGIFDDEIEKKKMRKRKNVSKVIEKRWNRMK
jgi:hypothetical protein